MHWGKPPVGGYPLHYYTAYPLGAYKIFTLINTNNIDFVGLSGNRRYPTYGGVGGMRKCRGYPQCGASYLLDYVEDIYDDGGPPCPCFNP